MLAMAAVGLAGCQLFEAADREPSPGAQPGSETPGPTAAAGSDIPVPDPLNPTTHVAGEEVDIPGGAIVYVGLDREEGGLVAKFRMTTGAPPSDAQVLTPDGALLALAARNGLVQTARFGDASRPPAPDDVLTLVVGDVLVAFEVGRAR
jgi:hypothetical protein